ncbi:MAG: hypothetical protein IJE00_03245 [Clostridia bacterium]|nr:hypothetical protein [Clostridia bacterium]
MQVDWYAKLHRTPGDTSDGRWLTVLFSVIGVGLSVLDFVLYCRYKHFTVLMIALSVLNVVFTYAEISLLCIRKYWFRYYRNLAVILFLMGYYAIIVLAEYSLVSLCQTLSWHITYLYFPFFLMPPAIVIVIAFYYLLRVIGE